MNKIARQLNVSDAIVSRDLEACRAEWTGSLVADTDALVAEELARIDRIEAEAWVQWRLSKGGGRR